MSKARFFTGLFFIGAGINHFVMPRAYLPLMPPALPAPTLLIYISGIAEILGGLGLILSPTRRPATWGLLALLVAIFPANVYAAQNGLQIRGNDVPPWILWARLPLQPLLMWWVWRVGMDKSK